MKRLDVNDPQVFNKWRALYHELTSAEQHEFMAECELRFSHQQHFNVKNFEHLFLNIPHPHPIDVLEIGGWKGELAHAMLSKLHLNSWHNIEACKEAVDKTVEMGSLPYFAETPTEFDWFKEPRTEEFDVCVSSNTIEHLSNEHFTQLVAHLAGIKTIMFEAPLKRAEETWQDYWGTHILEFEWNDIHALMASHGYKTTMVEANYCYVYQL